MNQKLLIIASLASGLVVVNLVNAYFAKEINYSTMTEWWINTGIMMVLVSTSIITYHKKLKVLYKIFMIPATWIVHAIMTIPSAMLLGILKLDPII